MQISILKGVFTDKKSDFRTSYPRNLIPVPSDQGISGGYLRPSDGIEYVADVPGVDRGGIKWSDRCYKVCGNKLIYLTVSDIVVEVGSVGSDGRPVAMDYSFDMLAIASAGDLYYFDGTTLTKVSDPDVGTVKSVLWVDGYFMVTDGETIAVSDLDDPFSFQPLKYGSSEVDPDEILSLHKLRNEVHAINRYTIEAFDNVGGTGFPFQRIDGAQVTKGAIGAKTSCIMSQTIAFMGSGRNEPVSVYLGANGSTIKVASREIDLILKEYSESDLSDAYLESLATDGHEWLYVHLNDKTLVYDHSASVGTGNKVWFILNSGIGSGRYLAKYHVWCYDKWIVGHPLFDQIGKLSRSNGRHWGDVVDWEFSTPIIYNNSMGALVHDIELISLTGRAALGDDPTMYTQYSNDGCTWSQARYIKVGKIGERLKRLVWLRQGSINHWRIQRFVGSSDSRLAIARLEVRIEPLAF